MSIVLSVASPPEPPRLFEASARGGALKLLFEPAADLAKSALLLPEFLLVPGERRVLTFTAAFSNAIIFRFNNIINILKHYVLSISNFGLRPGCHA